MPGLVDPGIYWFLPVFVFGVRPLPKLHELSAESWEGGGHVSGPMYLGHVSGQKDLQED